MNYSDESTPIKDLELDAHIRNTSSGIAGRNRWYDKSVSIFVESTSRAGGMGEHSPCDGLVVGAMMNHSLSESIDPRQFRHDNIPDEAVAEINSCTPEFERLDWVVDDDMEKKCAEAERHARQISDDSDASLLWFKDFGAQWVKDIGKLTHSSQSNISYAAVSGKLSPDAFAQLAMQLAWHKVQGYFTATYETATTQMFLRGRTETIRSFSFESWLFVKAMTDPRCPVSAHDAHVMRLFNDDACNIGCHPISSSPGCRPCTQYVQSECHQGQRH